MLLTKGVVSRQHPPYPTSWPQDVIHPPTVRARSLGYSAVPTQTASPRVFCTPDWHGAGLRLQALVSERLTLCWFYALIELQLYYRVVIDYCRGYWTVVWSLKSLSFLNYAHKTQKQENNFRVDSFRFSCQWLKGLRTILAILHLNLKMSFTNIFDMQHISFEILSPFCVVMSVICGHFCGCLNRGTINGRHN